MTEIRDIDEIADEVLPVDGPHTPDGVRAAAGLISELVRRLNHATFPGKTDRTLPYPSSVDAMVGRLQGAAGGLPQLLRQLARRLNDLAEEPGLYDDRRERAPSPARDVAWTAAGWLAEEATIRADSLETALAGARSCTTHLGLRQESEG